MAEPAWTVRALLEWTERFLGGKGVESPRLDAQVLLAHVLNWPRTQLYTQADDLPTEPQRTAFRELIRRRVEGCPVAYLVGKKEFFLLSYDVTPDVLIPRPATETLVVAALEKLAPGGTALDVGTGSGCVAISLAARAKTATITAIDVSPAALAVAEKNAARLGVGGRVRFLAGDLFAPLPADEQFSVIASNPPYIPADAIAELAKDVRDHEPRLALDGGADGLEVIRRLIAEAAARLTPGGWLMLEVGAGQSDAVRDLMAAAGFSTETARRDADGIPRVAVGRRNQ